MEKPTEERIRDEFRKAVIMAIHKGKTYEEALKKDARQVFSDDNHFMFIDIAKLNNYLIGSRGFSNEEDFANTMKSSMFECYKPKITIGRVMAALYTKGPFSLSVKAGGGVSANRGYGIFNVLGEFICNWQLLTPDGSECTDAEQSIETISSLLTLLKS